ncbi:LOW QUALITY PROTEIN: hypothetical protein V1477_012451 [Vespula maculifrons]|uniref:Uncharacterized protein n=1 Tax=Vespula maculifrons TaxID=7453 RepID=A0ABD2BXJ3_VESMC
METISKQVNEKEGRPQFSGRENYSSSSSNCNTSSRSSRTSNSSSSSCVVVVVRLWEGNLRLEHEASCRGGFEEIAKPL